MSGTAGTPRVTWDLTSVPSRVIWLSIDPVRCGIDFYPKHIASRIEQAYANGAVNQASTCDLGASFFNATVHFGPDGAFHQTTPGSSLDRIKQPGFRSVMRLELSEGTPRNIVVLSKRVRGEWRIAANEADSEVRLEEALRSGVAVEALVPPAAEPGKVDGHGLEASASTVDHEPVVPADP
jgi:hypothetical protein